MPKKVLLSVRVSEDLKNKYKVALAKRKESMQMHLARCIIEYLVSKQS